MKITFSVTPIGKPRQTQSDKWKKRPCVLAWRAFADRMRSEANNHNFRLPDHGARITFFLPMPASWSARQKDLKRGEPHRQKPDLDNCVKAVMDALRVNDCQVWGVSAEKRWADHGFITIETSA